MEDTLFVDTTGINSYTAAEPFSALTAATPDLSASLAEADFEFSPEAKVSLASEAFREGLLDQ